MMSNHAQTGRVEWIGLRSERLAKIEVVPAARIELSGLVGDHSRAGKRAVTLMQAEHLDVIARLVGLPTVTPETLRRNIVVSRINLLALKNTPIRIGSAILKIEGPCPPCSRMEKSLGHGGYNAMRGHGGWYASVIEAGDINLGSDVAPADY